MAKILGIQENSPEGFSCLILIAIVIVIIIALFFILSRIETGTIVSVGTDTIRGQTKYYCVFNNNGKMRYGWCNENSAIGDSYWTINGADDLSELPR